MDTPLVNAFVDYIVVDDKSRAVITFKFPHMSEDTRVTLIHDKAKNGIEPYVLDKTASTLMLSARPCEAIVINVWLGANAVAGGIYQVDTQSEDFVLRSICDSGIQLVQQSRLLSELEGGPFEWGDQFAVD